MDYLLIICNSLLLKVVFFLVMLVYQRVMTNSLLLNMASEFVDIVESAMKYEDLSVGEVTFDSS